MNDRTQELERHRFVIYENKKIDIDSTKILLNYDSPSDILYNLYTYFNDILFYYFVFKVACS